MAWTSLLNITNGFLCISNPFCVAAHRELFALRVLQEKELRDDLRSYFDAPTGYAIVVLLGRHFLHLPLASGIDEWRPTIRFLVHVCLGLLEREV